MSKSQHNLHGTVAVFGSAFNPPHRGHEDVIKQVLTHADYVLLVPSYCHAFGKQMAPYEQRLAMTKAMSAGLNHSLGLPSNGSVNGSVNGSANGLERIQVSDIERKISEQKAADQAIYTYDVLHALEEENPHASLIFVLGPDNAEPATWDKFYRSQDILDRWGTWVAKEMVPVRSTSIRHTLAQGNLPTERECAVEVIDILKTMNRYYGCK